MIGFDTNVLARIVLEDDPKESRIALQLLKEVLENHTLFISSYTMMELVWVLRTRKRNRQEIAAAIRNLMDLPNTIIGQRSAVAAALERYRNGKSDFADYLILGEGESFGARELASFDQELCKEMAMCKHPKESIC